MTEHVTLLPGWGFGPAVLEPLREALRAQAPALQVQVLPLPASDASDTWLEQLDDQIPPGSWLVGWSLGGMLATQLAARRGAGCPGLITLASNACFRTRSDWPTAMPGEVFDTFCQAFDLGPEETLRRFSMLCSRGAADPRTLARQLQVVTDALPSGVLGAGLALLARLDGRPALKAFEGLQLHLFGEGDALVPVAAAEALARLLPQARIEVLAGASHALPLERPDEMAACLLALIGEQP